MHFVAYAISETVSNPPRSNDVSGVCSTDRLQAATTRHRTTSHSKASMSLPVHRGIPGCLPALHKNWRRSCQCEISFSQVSRNKMYKKYHNLPPHLFSLRMKRNRPILKCSERFIHRLCAWHYYKPSSVCRSLPKFTFSKIRTSFVFKLDSTFCFRYLNCHIQPEPVILHALGINITEVSWQTYTVKKITFEDQYVNSPNGCLI